MTKTVLGDSLLSWLNQGGVIANDVNQAIIDIQVGKQVTIHIEPAGGPYTYELFEEFIPPKLPPGDYFKEWLIRLLGFDIGNFSRIIIVAIRNNPLEIVVWGRLYANGEAINDDIPIPEEIIGAYKVKLSEGR